MSTVVTSWTSTDPCPCCGGVTGCGTDKCDTYTVNGVTVVDDGFDDDIRVWSAEPLGTPQYYPRLIFFCGFGAAEQWDAQMPDPLPGPGTTLGPSYHNLSGLGGTYVPWDGLGCRTFYLSASVPGYPDSIEVCCND